ncbi:MAG: hypothetical protein FWD73_13145 [Polyangiaceae bacterium]|nr:hypothetical protein [Polyangiaceae bacterium]
MRFGLLGPARGDVAALGCAAEFLLTVARVQRAIYLGDDDALDRAVSVWARKLVGGDPSDDAAWRRAASLALSGTSEQIGEFVATERARLRLKSLKALPANIQRTVEIVGDRMAVLIYDEAMLDDEDFVAASLFFFGKSDVMTIRKVGERWFVSPGPVDVPGGGVAVVDDECDEVTLTIFDLLGNKLQSEVLTASPGSRRRVQSSDR